MFFGFFLGEGRKCLLDRPLGSRLYIGPVIICFGVSDIFHWMFEVGVMGRVVVSELLIKFKLTTCKCSNEKPVGPKTGTTVGSKGSRHKVIVLIRVKPLDYIQLWHFDCFGKRRHGFVIFSKIVILLKMTI